MSLPALIGRRFEIEKLAGKGGMSEVYRAVDRTTARPVALKIFIEKAGSENRTATRFAQEAEVLAGMKHPAIVEHVAHGVTEDGTAFLAMEWLEGIDLATRIAQGPIPIADVITLGTRLAGALATAHARGVVHRDVTPRNIVLTNGSIDGAKLIDFGIARVRGGAQMTRAGAALGTPLYMAPEQARGAADIDGRADLFALGSVLFECTAGKAAFWAEFPLAVMAKILLDEPPDLGAMRPDAPRELVALITRMLAKDRDARPADGNVVAEALAAIRVEPTSVAKSQEPARAAEPPPSLTARERKLLCVAFVAGVPDAPSEDSDLDGAPTQFVGGKSGNEIDEVYATVLRHGGWSERLVDGTLVITLPNEGSVEEQATRAARCALAVRRVMRDNAMVLVTGRAEMSAGVLPVGDVIDRGVRLLRAELRSSGERRGIAIDDVTGGLIDRRFVVGRAPDGKLLYLEAERDPRAEGGARTFLGKPRALVGRSSELDALVASFEACKDEQRARAVIVTAPSGFGKSRLARELVDAVSSRHPVPTVLFGRGDAARASDSLGVIRNALVRLFGLQEESAEAALHRVRARAGRNVARAEKDRVAAFLGELVDVRFPDDTDPHLAGARENPTRMADQIRAAWEDFVAAELANVPVLLVLDDVQHIDAPSRALVVSAFHTFADAPLFVLAMGRPGSATSLLSEADEGLVVPLELAPLPRDAAVELAKAALAPAASDEKLARIVDQADGNAFYLEELVRAVAEGRGDKLPETVAGMIETRLAALEPKARRVLRAASIYGAEFTLEALAPLVGRDDAETSRATALDLVRDEIFVKSTDDAGLSFRSGLVRETVYATLTEEDRALGHRLAAAWLSEHRGASAASLIADHYDRAGEDRSAAIWYAHAAEAALAANAFDTAIDRAERGAVAGASGPLLGRIRLLESEATRHGGNNAMMFERARAAMDLLPSGTPPWWAAAANAVLGAVRLGLGADLDAIVSRLEQTAPAPGERLPSGATRLAHYLHFVGRHEPAERILKRALADIGDFEADPAKWAWGYRAYATRAILAGDTGRYLGQLELAVRAFDASGDVREATSERVNVAFARKELGLYGDAEAALREALSRAERLGLRHVVGSALNNLGATLVRMRRFDEASPMLGRAATIFRELGSRRMEGNTQVYLALLELARGDFEPALAHAAEAQELLAQVKPMLPFALAVRARVHLTMRQPREALPLIEEAIRMLDDANVNPDEGESLIRLVWVETLEALGRLPEAARALKRARARLHDRANLIERADWRESFLGSVTEHVRIEALSREWDAS